MSFDTHTEAHSLEAATNAAHAKDQGQDVTIPLSRLFLSTNNVRKVRHVEDLPELAALIASQGLLHRLSVTQAEEGRFAVEAGGRRLAACQLLVAQGVYTADQPIDCRLYASERGVEISTAENSHEAMHPADQFEAFAKLLAGGLSEQQVASRFGVSVLTVQRRMTLASLAPRFIALFREGKASMEQLQALALATDHDVQIAAWDSLSEYQRSPYMLRNVLTSNEIEGDSRLAQFVGLDVYAAAGGAMHRDLFGEPNDCWVQDGALLHRLAIDRLEAAASVEREAGWSWVEAHLSLDAAAMSKFERQWPTARPMTPEEAELVALWDVLEREAIDEVQAIERAYDKAQEGSDEEGALGNELDGAETVLIKLREMKSAMKESLIDWTTDQRAICGVIVTVGTQGCIDTRRGLMRPQDRKALVQKLKKAGHSVPESLKNEGSGKSERAMHSETLMLDLTAHRTAALQASLVDNVHVALALVVHRLVEPIFCQHRFGAGSGPLKVATSLTRHTALASRATGYAHSPAATALEQAEVRWGERMPGQDLFGWLLKQEQSMLLEMLAFGAASALDDMQVREGFARAQAEALADALDVDMADWWEATLATYLERVSKVQLIQAVTEACGADVAKPMAEQKKGDAVAYAAAMLKGTRWLPVPLRLGVETH